MQQNVETSERLDQTVSCPIDTLPNELLEHIFLQSCNPAIPQHGWDHGDHCLNMKTMPWVVGQVCSRWRESALSFPLMWKDLQVAMYQKQSGETILLTSLTTCTTLSQSSIAIMQERLLRCKGIPLTVSLEYSTNDMNKEPIAEVTTLFALICAHCEQWEIARVAIRYCDPLIESVFNQVNGHLPRLEKLEWYGLPSTFVNFVLVAPALRILKSSPDRHARGKLIDARLNFFPWAQLTKVCLTAGKDLVYLRILQTSQRLQQLKLFHDTYPPLQPELRFSHLHCLCCCITALDVFLELPALEVLSLQDSDPFFPVTALPRFINRSSHSLRALILPRIWADEVSRIFIDVLDVLPGLQKLSVNVMDGDPTISLLKHLKVDPSRLSRVALPNLKELYFDNVVHGEMPVVLAGLGTIESRFSPDYDFPRLKSVEWFRPLKVSPRIRRRLIAMEKEGLKLKWK
ncbi:hypothetical protein C8J56DRAFT_917029 [Mycena floridula]|nr:hypothetical protein C8J56DRAFT_917029 [Mycena floridula]